MLSLTFARQPMTAALAMCLLRRLAPMPLPAHLNPTPDP